MFRVKLPAVSDLETGTHIWTFFHTPSLAVSVYQISASSVMPDRWACAIIDLNDPSRLAEWMVFDAHAAGVWVLSNGKERFFALPGPDPNGRRPKWFYRVLLGSLVPVQEEWFDEEVGLLNSGGHPVLLHQIGEIDCAVPHSQIVVNGEVCETVAALNKEEQVWIRIRRDVIERGFVVDNTTRFRLAPDLAIFRTAVGNKIVWSNKQSFLPSSVFFIDVSVNGETILFLRYSDYGWFWEWWRRSRHFLDDVTLESRYQSKHVEKFYPPAWHYPRLSPDLRWLIVPRYSEVLVFDVKED